MNKLKHSIQAIGLTTIVLMNYIDLTYATQNNPVVQFSQEELARYKTSPARRLYVILTEMQQWKTTPDEDTLIKKLRDLNLLLHDEATSGSKELKFKTLLMKIKYLYDTGKLGTYITNAMNNNLQGNSSDGVSNEDMQNFKRLFGAMKDDEYAELEALFRF